MNRGISVLRAVASRRVGPPMAEAARKANKAPERKPVRLPGVLQNALVRLCVRRTVLELKKKYSGAEELNFIFCKEQKMRSL